MAEHLTLVSLRRAVSAQAGVSEKVVDDFLNALIGSIQDGLQKDGTVSINGLGTFSLQDMPARKSVNVATGEPITIEGHKKVTFTAATAHSKKAEEPLDPIKKLGEQAEEIKDILSELNAMAPTAVASTATQEAPATPEAPAEPAPAPQHEPQPEQQPEPQPEPQAPKKKEKKPFNAWLTGLITIGVFAMLLIIAYFVLQHKIVSWADGMRSTIEQRVNTPEDKTHPLPLPQKEGSKQSGVMNENEQVKEEKENEPAQQVEEPQQSATSKYFDDEQRTFTNFQRVETVGKDSRLAWIAKKRYGEKAYWVFIYEANRDKLKAPDKVLPGMQLRVPVLPPELRDPNDPETAALLKRLSEKYLN